MSFCTYLSSVVSALQFSNVAIIMTIEMEVLAQTQSLCWVNGNFSLIKDGRFTVGDHMVQCALRAAIRREQRSMKCQNPKQQKLKHRQIEATTTDGCTMHTRTHKSPWRRDGKN